MQAQPGAGCVQPAAFVLFIKPVEHMGQRLGRNALARVAHGHGDSALALRDRKADFAAHAAEFDGVIHQVVHHLVHKVFIGIHHRFGGRKARNLDAVCLNALLGSEHHAGDGLPDVIAVGVHFIFARLQLCDVQHIFDKPRQAAHFLRDNLQIMLVVLGRDGSVQHPVHKALHSRHGRAQLVRNIAHKAVARRIDFLQIFRHAVKRGGQLRHLIVPLYRHPGGKIAVAEFLRRVRNAAQRGCHVRGKHNGQYAGHQQHQPCRQNKHGKQVCNIFVQPPRI